MLAFQLIYEILGVSVKKSNNLLQRSDWSEWWTDSSAQNGIRLSDWPSTGLHVKQCLTKKVERGKKLSAATNQSSGFVQLLTLTPKLNRLPFIREFATLSAHIFTDTPCHQNLQVKEPRRPPARPKPPVAETRSAGREGGNPTLSTSTRC